MYTKMLIPTDGSPFSTEVALAGIELGRQLNAQIMSVFVAPEFQYPIYVEALPPNFPSESEYRSAMVTAGEKHISPIRDAAILAGLNFSYEIAFSDETAREIAAIAKRSLCDLIFMGSHGRSGWGQLLLGSVTNKVLSSCHIPVLVHRPEHSAR